MGAEALLEAALAPSESPELARGAVLTLVREESVADVRVAGESVYTRAT